MDFEDGVSKKTTKTKRVQFEAKALLQNDRDNKSSYQVKILMTKEEAIRLLSKYKHGNILDLKDVAHHLTHTKKVSWYLSFLYMYSSPQAQLILYERYDLALIGC